MSDVRVISDLPVPVNAEAVLRQMRIQSGSAAVPYVEGLIERVRTSARPRALYRACSVERIRGDRVRVDDVEFTSRTLANLLLSVDRVYPYIVTCGRELEEVISPDSKTIEKLALDVIGNMMLQTNCREMEEHLRRLYGMEKTARIGPGAGDGLLWRVEEQAKLFELFGDAERAIGVRLTEDFMMLPMKSLSGLLFETETEFSDCQLCQSEGCPMRSAPFDPAVRDALTEIRPADPG